MKAFQKYITNISALQFIQLLRFSNLFLIGIVFVRIFSAEQIGYYETLIFVAGAVSFFWLRGILQSFLSLIKSSDKNNQFSYFNGFVVLVLLSVIAAAFLAVTKDSLALILNDGQPVMYAEWLIIYIIFSSPANLIEYVYLGTNQPKKIIWYGTISQSAQFLFVIIPAILGYNLEISIIGLVSVNVLRFIWLIFIIGKYSNYKLNKTFILQHIKLAYPLIISSLLSGSAQYIDGLLITYYYDSAMFAIFRYGARELPIALILANAFSNAMIPEFSSLNLDEALNKLKRNTTRLIHFLFPVTFVLLATSNWLFPLVFSDEYAFSAKIFNVYLLLVICRLLFPQTILIGLKKTKVFLWVSLIEISVNVTLSVLFINLFGVIGVAYATIVAFLTEKLILIGLVRLRLNININQYIPIGIYTVYSIFAVVLYFIIDLYIFK